MRKSKVKKDFLDAVNRGMGNREAGYWMGYLKALHDVGCLSNKEFILFAIMLK